jgi:transposase
LQALHRVRERLVGQRTGIINQIRAFLLERGVAVRQGLRFLRAELPTTLATLFRRPYLAEIFVSVGQLIAAKAGPYERLEPPASTMTAALCLG